MLSERMWAISKTIAQTTPIPHMLAGYRGPPAAVAFRWVRSHQPLPGVLRFLARNSSLRWIHGRWESREQRNFCHYKYGRYYSCKKLPLMLPTPRCRRSWGREPEEICIRGPAESEEANFYYPAFTSLMTTCRLIWWKMGVGWHLDKRMGWQTVEIWIGRRIRALQPCGCMISENHSSSKPDQIVWQLPISHDRKVLLR